MDGYYYELLEERKKNHDLANDSDSAVGQENKRANDNLKENSEILEKARNELFGADFRKVIKEKAKARKDSNSVYRAKQRPSTSSTETGATSFHNK